MVELRVDPPQGGRSSEGCVERGLPSKPANTSHMYTRCSPSNRPILGADGAAKTPPSTQGAEKNSSLWRIRATNNAFCLKLCTHV